MEENRQRVTWRIFIVVVVVVIMSASSITAQPNLDLYSYSCVGNCEHFNDGAMGSGGLWLAGGGTDVDAAAAWFVKRAGGGDVVVLRTSGGSGYNDYFYQIVPDAVNSVSTFVMANTQAASDAFLLGRVANATAIFWAGGDQWTYYSYVKETPLQTILQNAIAPSSCSSPSLYPSKNAVYGGTSAVCFFSGFFFFFYCFSIQLFLFSSFFSIFLSLYYLSTKFNDHHFIQFIISFFFILIFFFIFKKKNEGMRYSRSIYFLS